MTQTLFLHFFFVYFVVNLPRLPAGDLKLDARREGPGEPRNTLKTRTGSVPRVRGQDEPRNTRSTRKVLLHSFSVCFVVNLPRLPAGDLKLDARREGRVEPRNTRNTRKGFFRWAGDRLNHGRHGAHGTQECSEKDGLTASPDASPSNRTPKNAPREGTRPTTAQIRSCRPRALTRRRVGFPIRV